MWSEDASASQTSTGERSQAYPIAARLMYATKRDCANHDLWHMVEDIWIKRRNRIRVHKVASTHSFKDVDKEAERSTAEATPRKGNLAADDAAKGVHAARSIWSHFDHKDIQACATRTR